MSWRFSMGFGSDGIWYMLCSTADIFVEFKSIMSLTGLLMKQAFSLANVTLLAYQIVPRAKRSIACSNSWMPF